MHVVQYLWMLGRADLTGPELLGCLRTAAASPGLRVKADYLSRVLPSPPEVVSDLLEFSEKPSKFSFIRK